MAELQQHKCPSCGGALEFDSKLQKLKCPYCDSTFEIAALQTEDAEIPDDPPEIAEDLSWNTSAGSEWSDGETDGMNVYVCRSCGGEIVCDPTTAASSCPYCGNPVVMKGQFAGDLRPDLVIPFRFDKKQAKEALANHFKGKILLPNVFKDENHIDEIKGVYVPFWLFGTDANAQMKFKGTKIRTWSDANYNYTETSYYSVYRSGSMGFANVPADGSSKMPDDLMESLEPFDLTQAVDFQTAYLAGYLADRYDVTAEQSMERANERIKATTEQSIRNKSCKGYLTLNLEYSSIQYRDSLVKYALLPVWILNTSWNGQNYQFAMNGQTGKFVGNLPVDRKKYWTFAGMFTGIFAVIAYLAMTYFYIL